MGTHPGGTSGRLYPIEGTASNRIGNLLLTLVLSGGLFFSQEIPTPLVLAELTAVSAGGSGIIPEEKRYALLIGVDKYNDEEIYITEGQKQDVLSLRETLIKYAGFRKEHVFVLTTDSSASATPSRTEILKWLSELKRSLPSDAFFVFAFSGHGVAQGKEAFLLPEDAVLRKDISLLRNTAISVATVRQEIEAARFKQVLILLDACRNSPQDSKGLEDNPLTNEFMSSIKFENINKGIEAVIVFYASKQGQKSFKSKKSKKGFFTSAIIEGLEGKAADEKGAITVNRLIKYVQGRVPEMILSENPGNDQKPFAETSGYRVDDLVLAYLPGIALRPDLGSLFKSNLWLKSAASPGEPAIPTSQVGLTPNIKDLSQRLSAPQNAEPSPPEPAPSPSQTLKIRDWSKVFANLPSSPQSTESSPPQPAASPSQTLKIRDWNKVFADLPSSPQNAEPSPPEPAPSPSQTLKIRDWSKVFADLPSSPQNTESSPPQPASSSSQTLKIRDWSKLLANLPSTPQSRESSPAEPEVPPSQTGGTILNKDFIAVLLSTPVSSDLTFVDAMTYCRQRGKRLPKFEQIHYLTILSPTEEQWVSDGMGVFGNVMTPSGIRRKASHGEKHVFRCVAD